MELHLNYDKKIGENNSLSVTFLSGENIHHQKGVSLSYTNFDGKRVIKSSKFVLGNALQFTSLCP